MGMFVVAPAASFHHHHHHHQHDASSLNLAAAGGDPNATALGVGVGVIPLLTATPCLSAQNMEDQDFMNTTTGRNNKISSTGIQFWQNQTQFNHHNNNNNTNRSNPSANNLLLPTGGGIGGNSASSSGGGTATCQDCGNQAKKDCTHRRCRTCCKSRGYDCSTHVKSTWVPAARRRERQLMSTTGGGGGGGGACSSGSTSGAKKPRLINSQTTTSHTSTSNTNTPRSFDTSSSHQDHGGFNKEGLPGQVRAPAVFKCVRVTAVDDGEDEYAYQAMVKIGGHVFKGFLYDQGVFDQTRDQSNFPNFSELHLGNANSSDHGGGGGGGIRNVGASTSSPILDPAEVYASASAAAGGLLAGGGHSAYGNPIN